MTYNCIHACAFSAFIFDVVTTTTSQNDRVTVRLNNSCVESPTTFMSTLSYASCPNYVTFQECQNFSSSGTATSEAVAITFVLTMISALIIGVISSSLVTYCIMKRRASEHLTADQPKSSLYEEVSQPKTSEQMFDMGSNVAYGPVRH